VVLDDFFRRDQRPAIVQPGVPLILRISSTRTFHLESGFDDVSGSAAVKRFVVQLPVGVLVVIGPLEVLKPFLVGPIGPVSVSQSWAWEHKENRSA
jgi:hypothetical protein